MINRRRFVVIGLLVALGLSGCAVFPAAAAPAGDKPWSFAAIADNRGIDQRLPDTYESVLNEIRDMKVNPAPKFPPIEFVVACGDVMNAADDYANWRIWLKTFKNAKPRPCYYPVLGNWDGGDIAFNKDVILPAQKNVVGKDPTKYCVDWKNVRVIVGNDLKYVEGAIRSAPKTVEHIFVADHYPIFPRRSYVRKPSAQGIEFWNLLLANKAKVRAYLTGHTHNYSRMRVADPSGAVATDLGSLPDEAGGIYQIDCGSAGVESHSDRACTIVEIAVAGKDLRFRAVQSPQEKPSQFQVKDEWKFTAP